MLFLFIVQLIENHESVYTIENGDKMALTGLKQTKPEADEYMYFTGKSQVRVIVAGLIIDDIDVSIESHFKVYADGTFQFSFIVNDQVTVEDSGNIDLENLLLIEYSGAYFMPDKDEALYIRQ